MTSGWSYRQKLWVTIRYRYLPPQLLCATIWEKKFWISFDFLTDFSQLWFMIWRLQVMPKMLIADDDIHLRKLVLTHAQMNHFECQEAESGP